MMNESILARIRSLPPLPETILELQKVCSNPEASLLDLAKVVEKDPMVTANLIKAANSPFYGFSREIASVAQAVSLFGMSTVKGIAMSNSVSSVLKIDLAPYGIAPHKFAEISAIQNALLQKWKPTNDRHELDLLITASFLQEIGKVVIAQEIIKLGKTAEFKAHLDQVESISDVEKLYIGETTAGITAAVFEQWRFEEHLTEAIRASDSPLDAEEGMRLCAGVLHITKTLVNPLGMFSEKAIEEARIKATAYKLPLEPLNKAIEFMQEKLA
jgi:HD-like signal output (HDOD) protein